MVVVLDCPVNRVAEQSVLAAECGEMPVFQTAQSSLGRSPENAVTVEPQAVDLAVPQPVRGCVRCGDSPFGEVLNAPAKKTEPHAAPGVSGDGHRMIPMPQPGPRNLLHCIPIA